MSTFPEGSPPQPPYHDIFLAIVGVHVGFFGIDQLSKSTPASLADIIVGLGAFGVGTNIIVETIRKNSNDK